MDTRSKVFHDLKTERSDVAQPLPAVASALPIAFYLACIGAIGLNIMFWMNTKEANAERDQFKQAQTSEIKLKGDLVAKRQDLDKEVTQAEDVRGWIEGSRSFQPLIDAIAKSVDSKTSIVELGLSRDKSNSNQVQLSVKFDGLRNSRSQIEATEMALQSMGYRPYNVRRTRDGAQSLNYQATLLWQKAGSNQIASRNTQE